MSEYKPYTKILRVIKTTNSDKAIAQEYGLLSFLFGELNEDWFLHKQKMTYHEEPNGVSTPVDVFQIRLDNGSCFEICIDISSYYGKDY